MRHETVLYILAFSAIGRAAPLRQPQRREVPQEHSHNTFLDSVRTSLAVDNPDNIQDPVFGLLGNAAAAAGQGSITDTDCLHQATADQAFTNAKAAADVKGMTDALIYAALERNTGKVGLASVDCTAIKATNPEIAAVSQHQDPASEGAAAKNKAVTLALAKQIASVGGDPQEALKSGTFAPGDVNDATGKGNSCDTADDEPGCIFTQNLLVEDATADEIDAAVAGVAASVDPVAADPAAVDPTAANTTATGSSNSTSPASSASTGLSTAVASTNKASDGAPFANSTTPATGCGSASPSSPATSSTPSTSTANNVQTFTGALGGAPPPVVSSASDRPFSVNGATFLNSGAALQRSCDIQHNACASAANSGSLAGGVGQCDDQQKACTAASKAAKKTKRALDLGSCSDPTVKFAEGLDGRKEASFAPVNSADFNHGSALNIGVISGFICQQLQDKCKAGADATAACAQGQTASADLKGQAAADAFNAALGGSAATDTASTEAVGTATEDTQASSCTSAPTTAQTEAVSTPASSTTSTPAAAENNIQTFTGALGGLPPPVTETAGSDRPFSVKGDTFVNAAAALQRSCAVQHNACANAANSGALAGGVGQCETQEGACNEAN